MAKDEELEKMDEVLEGEVQENNLSQDGTEAATGIEEKAVESTMESYFLRYSMSVIIDRALPDVRDGLKPVNRRILYAMNKNGWKAPHATVKSDGSITSPGVCLPLCETIAARYILSFFPSITAIAQGQSDRPFICE